MNNVDFKINPVWLIIGLIIVFCFVPWIGAWSIVGSGNVGVVTRFGAVNRVAYPGVAFQIPFFEYIHQMSTRTEKDQVDTQAASQDLQEVKATIAVNYHLDGTKAVQVYQNIGTDYQTIVVAPAIQNTFKAVTAKYTAEQLIKNREAVGIEAEKTLKEQLAPYHVIVENFNIVNFDFSTEYNNAVEQKQVAQQSVEKASLDLERIQVEASQAAAQAKGQADAQAELKNSGSLTPEYLEYLFLNKWNGTLPTYMGGGLSTFLNVNK